MCSKHAGDVGPLKPTFRTRLATIFIYIQGPESEQNLSLPGGEIARIHKYLGCGHKNYLLDKSTCLHSSYKPQSVEIGLESIGN
jgi:hypothetical protein